MVIPRRFLPASTLLALGLLIASLLADHSIRADEAGRADESGRAAATLERPAATVIAPTDALAHVGKESVVEFVVLGGRKLDDKEICFLNSTKNHRQSDTFTAVIFRTGLARYAADGIDDPAAAFRGKTVRVSGVIEEHNGQAQIVVASPTQIEVVDEDEPVSRAEADR